MTHTQPISSTLPNWIAVCTANDIPALGSRRVKRAVGLEVALFKTADGEVFALLDRCPHKGGPLSQGIVFGHSVACPLHNWTIALRTGAAMAPDEGCTPAFAVRVEGGVVHLDADELARHATDLTRPRAGPSTEGVAGKTVGMAVCGVRQPACHSDMGTG
jgi:nitrite reductase (NADH) small subunit